MNTVEKLTPRELQCLHFAAKDKSVHETAAQLCVGLECVKKHRKMILQKLHCRTIGGALAIALKNHLISF